jgi:hypothetical protein
LYFEGYIELVPDLVWVKSHNPATLDHHYTPGPDESDPILSHQIPKFPDKFLLRSPPVLKVEDVSIVWTAVIVTIIHFLFDFFR